jgi:protoporphyrinogen oxidase
VRRAGHVIVAVAPSAAAGLLPEELEAQRRFFDSVIYSPSPMPVFFLDRPLDAGVWTYFSDPKLRKTFMFALDEHAKVPEMSPSGKAILTAWTGHPMSLDLIDLPDDKIIEKAREDVEWMIPGFSHWVEEAVVFRHPYGIARYPAGAYRRVLDFREQARQLEGVSFVSDLFGGCYMEAAMISAAEAVRRVCGWGGTV